jgi:Fe-S cluster biogenesis protein NfuA
LSLDILLEDSEIKSETAAEYGTMFIQTETTPNPAAVKFLPGREVLPEGSADFREQASAKASPLATRLFAIEGVAGVFLGADFITVSKTDKVEWRHLKPQVLSAMMEHFVAGLPVMGESKIRAAAQDMTDQAAPDGETVEKDTDIVNQIKELLDSRVRPAVAQDGGDIVFKGFDKGIVYLHMRGACSGCPSSTATLRHGIENLLRHYIPDVIEVRPV